ncbi:MAG: hypothetical protein J5999_09240 [Oscillospiraceae bacterium]|nr:hypothetical protein [Oscillospiraceae bacterium]
MKDIVLQTEKDIQAINKSLDKAIGTDNLKYYYDEEGDLCSVSDFRENFKDILKRYGIDPSRRSAACREICELINRKNDSELTYLWILLFLDEGVIYPYRDEDADKVSKADKRALIVSADIFEDYCNTEAEYARRFERLRDTVSKKHGKVKCNSKVPTAAFKVTRDHLLGTRRDGFEKDIMENMKRIQDMSGQYEGLNVILPLIMFTAVTRNAKSFADNSNNVLTVDIRKLLNRKPYKIDRDNGKNFDKFERDIKFFMELTRAYSKQFAVDTGFCYYCFGRVTNLPEWAAAYPLGNDFASAYLTAPKIAEDMRPFSDDEEEYCCKKREVDPELLGECFFNSRFGEIVGGSDSLYDKLFHYCEKNPAVRGKMHRCFLDGDFDKACEISEKIGTTLSDSCVTLNKENFDYGVCYIYEYFLTDEIVEIRKLMLDTLNKSILLIDD